MLLLEKKIALTSTLTDCVCKVTVDAMPSDRMTTYL